MKTQAQKLSFKKENIIELNDENMYKILGGTGGFDEATGTGDPDRDPPTGEICKTLSWVAAY